MAEKPMALLKSIRNLKFNSVYILFFACAITFYGFAYSEVSRAKSTHFHNGMECCKCFFHCSCFGQCIGEHEVCFPKDKTDHPLKLIDTVWHEFMKGILTAKKVGPYLNLDKLRLGVLVDYRMERNIHSISEYLNIIEEFKKCFAAARIKNINLSKEIYSSPLEKFKLEEDIQRIDLEYKNANEILDEIPSKILPLYEAALKKCSHMTPFSIYNKGILCSLKGDWDHALAEIQTLINLTKNKTIKLDSKVYQICGEACLEVHLFNEAVEALTTAINKNPENKQAYFYRASAYFELGNFDQAIEDYLMSDKGKTIYTKDKASSDFTAALINSTRQGASEAVTEFVPSLCHSAYGVGTALWAMYPLNPLALENTKKFANSCYEMGECFVEYCKTIDSNFMNECVEQMKILYERFDQLNDAEKGELIGYTIGKYGVDIFASSLAGGALIKGGQVLVKGASHFRKLKNINRACNLEAMAVSSANKEAITSSALKHTVERDAFFNKITLEVDKQNKHIVGSHNFRPGSGELIHSDASGLLAKFAGKGKPISNKAPGIPDYRERVDFGEFIGYYVNPKNPDVKMPTTKGIIHYSKKGAHIVPSHPNGN